MNQCITPVHAELQQSIALEGNAVWSMTLDGQSLHILVTAGLCWITLEGDRNDYAVQAGETLHLHGSGLLVIQGLADQSKVQLAVMANR